MKKLFSEHIKAWHHASVWMLVVIYSLTSIQAYSQQIIGPSGGCVGDELAFRIEPPTVGHVYSWSIASGGAVTSGIPGLPTQTVLMNSAGPATISVAVTDANGTAIALQDFNISISIAAQPLPIIRAEEDLRCLLADTSDTVHGQPLDFYEAQTDCFQACAGQSFTYYTKNVVGSTFTWAATGAQSYTTNGNEITVIWASNTSQGLLKVTETNAAGCTGVHEQCIVIKDSPTASFSTMPGNSVCLNQTLYFADASIGATQWYWDFGNGETMAYDVSSPNPGPQVSYTSPGTYTVTLKVENDCRCESIYTQQVTVSPNSAPEIECIGVACEGTQATYRCLTACSSYNWNVTNGNIISANADVVIVQWTAGATGTLEVATTGCGNGCPNTMIQVPVIPSSVTIEGVDVACTGSREKYWVQKMPGTTYTWSVTPALGTIVAGNNTNEITVDWGPGGTGVIDLTYDNTVFNCTGSTTKSVTLAKAFEFSGAEEACLDASELYISSSASSFDWEVQDESGAIVYGPQNAVGSNLITFNFGSGEFFLIARKQNPNFCNTEFVQRVTVTSVPPLLPGSIEGPSLVCPNDFYEFSAVPTSPDYFIDWKAFQGIGSTTAQGNEATFSWSAQQLPAIVEAVQRMKDSPHCASDPISTSVYSKLAQTSIDFDDPKISCTRDFTVQATADYFEWAVTNTKLSIVSGQGTNQITVNANFPPVGPTSTSANLLLTMHVCGTTIGGNSPYNLTVSRPVAPLIPASIDACVGEPVTIAIQNGNLFCDTQGDFVWTYDNISNTGDNLSITHTFTAPGSYPVVVYFDPDPNGAACNQSSSISLDCLPLKSIVTVLVKPALDILVTASEECLNESNPIVLHCQVRNNGGAGSYSYNWGPSGGTGTGSTYTVTSGANYSCTVTDNITGCASADNFQIIDQCGVGSGSGSNNCQLGYGVQINNVSLGPVTVHSSSTCSDLLMLPNIVTNMDPNSFPVTVPNPAGGLPYVFDNKVNWLVEDPAGDVTGYGATFSHTFSASGYHNVIVYDTICWNDTVWFDPNNPYNHTIEEKCCVDSQSTWVHVPLYPDLYHRIGCNSSNQLQVELFDNSNWTALNMTNYTHTFSATGPVTQVGPNLFDIDPGATGVAVTFTINWSNPSGPQCSKSITVITPSALAGVVVLAPNQVCEGIPVDFASLTTGDVVSYEWDFDDNTGDISANPSRTYRVTGAPSLYPNASTTYNPSLTVTDVYGCTASQSKPILVTQNIAESELTPSSYSGCQGNPVALTVNGLNGSIASNFDWSTGNTTSSSIFVNKSGDYSATFFDQNGCPDFAGSANVKMVPRPQSHIRGPEDVCFGENVVLNGFQGDDFTYKWSVSPTTPVSSSTTQDITSYAPSVGTYSYILTVTETYSGLNCTDASASHAVTVKALPAVPTLASSGSSPLCMGPSRTLTATSSAVGDFNWSVGNSVQAATSSSAIVDHPGQYSVTFTDAGECESSSSVNLYPDPDFTEFMSGCYEFCHETSHNWPGVPGFYKAYKWYQDGSVVASGAASASPAGLGIQIPTHLVDVTGEYQLEVTTVHGCTEISPVASIYFLPCANPCSFSMSNTEVECIGTNDEGENIFYIELDFLNVLFPAACSIDPQSNGTVSNQSPQILGSLDQSVGFTFTNTSGNLNPCFSFTVSGMDPLGPYTCTRNICIQLPEDCEIPSCELGDFEDLQINCLTNRLNGYNDYDWSFILNNLGNNDLEILQISDLATLGSVGFTPATMAPGNTQINATFSSYSAVGETICLRLLLRDVSSGKICSYDICSEIPACDNVPTCNQLSYSEPEVECMGFDPAGNPLFSISMEVLNTTGSPITLAGITTTQGTIANYGSILPAGTTPVNLVLSALPPFYDPVCITFWIVDQGTGQLIPCDVCIGQLPCIESDPVPMKRGAEAVAWEDVSSLKLYPNPSTDHAIIDFQQTEDLLLKVVVRDAYARIVFQSPDVHSGTPMEIETANWASGTYFVFVIKDDWVIDQRLLIKQ